MAASYRIGPAALVILGLLAGQADARPEKIEAGVPYYSDDFVEEGLVRDIAAEKNYEEVYQFYTYYEASYDEADRVVAFIEYKRGDVLRREEYAWDQDGTLLTRTVKIPGQPPHITRVTPDEKDDRATPEAGVAK